jgi:hypothetical protein
MIAGQSLFGSLFLDGGGTADNAVVTSHPSGSGGSIQGSEAVRSAETDYMFFHTSGEDEFTEAQVSGNTVAFNIKAFSSVGCFGGGGHVIVVTAGKIASYDWGTAVEPCT